MTSFQPSIDALRPDDGRLARERQARLTKPPGSLGRLEDLAVQLAAIQGRAIPTLDHPRVVLFAADHGVTAHHAVSPYPRSVTAQMVLNILGGGAAISTLARRASATLEVVDVGVDADLSGPSSEDRALVDAKVGRGSHDFTERPAMDHDQFERALQAGDDAAERAYAAGCEAIAVGEMGIGNTTAASAVACGLLGVEPEAMVGPGTGADAAMMKTKADVIGRALARHRPGEPWEVLRTVGGLELAAIAGLVVGAASRRVLVVSDGFIVSAAVAAALARYPAARDFVVAAHRSAEPGHRRLLEFMKTPPLLDLGLRLGEGSGAALALPLIRAAVAAHANMATFEAAGVEDRPR